MASPDWKSQIEAAIAARPLPIKAMTYGGKKWETDSKPRLLRCRDEKDYVVKGRQVVREHLISEQVVGTLAALVGAPTPPMPLVGYLYR